LNRLLTISRIVLGVAVALVIGWDVYAQLAGGLESTASWAIWELQDQWKPFGFIVGFFMGHLFFRSSGSDLLDFDRIKFVPGDFVNEGTVDHANALLRSRFTAIGNVRNKEKWNRKI
jgi:hypothetical protein